VADDDRVLEIEMLEHREDVASGDLSPEAVPTGNGPPVPAHVHR